MYVKAELESIRKILEDDNIILDYETYSYTDVPYDLASGSRLTDQDARILFKNKKVACRSEYRFDISIYENI